MRLWTPHLLLLTLIALAPTPVASGLRASIGTPYELSADSAWLEGCIVGKCLCPVALLDDLTGEFALVELPTVPPGPQRLFAVHDLHWILVRGDARIDIRGSGFYQTAAPVLDEQRLMLDLELDGVPLATLDSGLVPGGSSFPKIQIQALTSGECFQEGVQLAAAPVPEASLTTQRLSALFVFAGLLGRRRVTRSSKLRVAEAFPTPQ